MKLVYSKEFIDESLADKARWFSRLSMDERIAWLGEWTEIILQNSKALEKFGDDNTFQGSVRILRKTSS